MRLKPGRLAESGARPCDVEDVLDAEGQTIQRPCPRRLCLDVVVPAERSELRRHWLLYFFAVPTAHDHASSGDVSCSMGVEMMVPTWVASKSPLDSRPCCSR